MTRFPSLVSSILVAISVSWTGLTAPTHDDLWARHTTRGLVEKRGLKNYHPPTSFETFGEGKDADPGAIRPSEPGGRAKVYVAQKLNVDAASVAVRSTLNSDDISHTWVQQTINDIPFANAVANVAIKGDKVISFGSSFVKPTKVADPKPKVELASVLSKIEEALGGKYNNHPIQLKYLARPDGSAALVHTVQIQNEEENTWYEAYVDAHSGELLSAVDFVTHAGYRVVPITRQALPDGLAFINNPQDTLASPSGWHSAATIVLTTSGNNAIAYQSSTGTASQSSPNTFDYTYDDTLPASSTVNVNAANTNAFYVANMFHDFTYRYGFTESAFNFQSTNFGLGGAQNDRVTISVQSTGIGLTDFSTPPDGQSGQCRLSTWASSMPSRDASMSNDIIIHEFTHGLTNRLTGGGTGTCLTTTQSRGLGEGWSDALAGWAAHENSSVPDFVFGAWFYNIPGGIRTKPYSTSPIINDLTYASASGLTSVHAIGEVWANMLHNVYAALVSAHGWSSISKTNPSGTEGNIVWLNLLIDALKLQPCNPTFVSARAAWIQADQNRYGGANKCLLWNVFASRGLGSGATTSYTNNYAVPTGC